MDSESVSDVDERYPAAGFARDEKHAANVMAISEDETGKTKSGHGPTRDERLAEAGRRNGSRDHRDGVQCRGDDEESLALPRAPASVEWEGTRTVASREGQPWLGGMETPRPG
eukprot:8483229-Heterocapsa_arctica.AAC.2